MKAGAAASTPTDPFAPAQFSQLPDRGLLSFSPFATQQPIFKSFGWEGNGYDWTTVVKYLVDTRAPTIAGELDYDPEADMFSVTSANESALRTVAELIRLAVDDEAVLMMTVGACELD